MHEMIADAINGQAVMEGDRLSVLDLDDAAMSEPAVDIANFAAHLDLMGLQHPAHAPAITLVQDSFLARSREVDPDLDESLLAFLTASTLLRLAGIHAPRAQWQRIAADLLARARETLAVIA
jgi:hypothetical protein